MTLIFQNANLKRKTLQEDKKLVRLVDEILRILFIGDNEQKCLIIFNKQQTDPMLYKTYSSDSEPKRNQPNFPSQKMIQISKIS